jgi:mono/diheme cytochrome c family protein
MAHESNSTTIIFLAVIGVALVLAVVGVILWIQTLFPGGATQSSEGASLSYHSGRRVKLEPALVLNVEEAEAVSEAAEETTAESATSSGASAEAAGTGDVDLEAVTAAVNKAGCSACHTIPDIPGAIGVVGPSLANIGLDGATRRPDYTAEAYIRESLLQPNAFTAPECPTGPCITGAMPQIVLDDPEIELLVSYLSTLGVN